MSKDSRRRLLRLFFIFQVLLPVVYAPVSADAARAAVVLRVTVPANVELGDEAFVLSEIAEIDGPDAAAKVAGGLLISVRNGSVTRQQVIDALKTSGLDGVKIELKMPETVTVNKPSNSNSKPNPNPSSKPEISPGGATVTRRASLPDNPDLSALVKELAVWSGGVEVKVKGDVPKGRLVAPASIVPGSPSATLTFRDDAGRERSVSARMIWTESALVMTRSVKRGEILSASDVTVRQLRVNKAGAYISRPEDVVGRALRRNLSQGEAIQKDLLITSAAVTKGKSVTIVAQNGGLVVRTKGEALESGAVGEVIRVRNVSSKTIIRATVTAADTVEVKM
ncbi:hypothetical protein FACS1894204_05630 [Synergistales bacterium]|nr:hypothetical protein FACS1894204_05630 [Synergistales bacterium]